MVVKAGLVGKTVTCIHKGGATDPLTVGSSYTVVDVNVVKNTLPSGVTVSQTVYDVTDNIYATYKNCPAPHFVDA